MKVALPMLLAGVLQTAFEMAFAASGVPAAIGAQATGTRLPGVITGEPEPLFATPTRLDRAGRIVAPVYINGQGPFRLVVDTGASHSTVSPELAQKLGLEPRADERIVLNGVTGVAEVPVVGLGVVRAGELILQDVRAPVVYSSVMAGAEGILGVAGMKRERIFVDFRADRITISKSGSVASLGKYMKVPGRLVNGGLLAVDVRIGGVTARAIIDTGAERTLGNGALREALRSRKKFNAARPTRVFGTTEDISQGELEVAPPIEIGPANISDVSVVYGDFHIFKVWELEKRPAMLIGMDVLGTVDALVIDFRRRELYLLSG